MHPGREKIQGEHKERSRATIFDCPGKDRPQKDLRDVLTYKRKAAGESPPTIEIRDDKPGENTRQGSEKETTGIPPAIQAQIDALAATVQGLKKTAQPVG